MKEAESIQVRMVINAWETYAGRTDKLLNSLPEEQFLQEISPGRNRGIYLLGHLTAVHDGMPRILGFEEPQYPDLEHVFIRNPDKAGLPTPGVAELLKCWHNVSERLNRHIHSLGVEDWFGRHMSVSEEDFAKEPWRNKLNIIVNRTNHLAYHLGQLALLGKK